MTDNPNLEKCFNALMNAADALEHVAGKVAEAACGLHTLFGDGVPVPRAEAAVPEAATPEPVAVEVKPLTVDDVRAVLSEKSRDGFTDELRQILAANGAARLSDIDAIKYPSLLAAAEKLGAKS